MSEEIKQPRRKTKLHRGRGRPTLDSKRSPHDLSEREWSYAQYRALGYSPEESGQRLEVVASSQQTEKWEENRGIQRAIAYIRRSNPLAHQEIARNILADRVQEIEMISDLKRATYHCMHSWMSDEKASWEIRLKVLQFLTQREEHLLTSHRKNKALDASTNEERQEFEIMLAKLKGVYPEPKKIINLDSKRTKEAKEID